MVMELGAKRLGLLHELLPGAVRIAVLVDPNFPITKRFVANIRLRLLHNEANRPPLRKHRSRDRFGLYEPCAKADALLVGPSALFNNHRVKLVTLARRTVGCLAIYTLREFATAGGLMSYGASLTDAHRQAGVYTGRILKGEKPANLPVMQSTKFEFVINLNTAKALGLSFPPALLAIADEVIE